MGTINAFPVNTAKTSELTPVGTIDFSTDRVLVENGSDIVRRQLVNDFINESTDTIAVRSTADLPTPSGGFIDLAANTIYDIQANLTIADTIRFPAAGGTYITSKVIQKYQIIYVGGGNLFDFSNVATAIIDNVVFIGIGTATLHVLDTVDRAAFFFCVFAAFASGGSITDGTNVLVIEKNTYTQFTAGLTFDNNIATSFRENSFAGWNDAGGTFLTFTGTGTFASLLIADNNLSPAASETVVDIQNTATYLGFSIINNTYTGVGTFFDATGLDQTDILVFNNPFVPNSTSKGFMSVNGNATATTISVIGQDEKVNATFTEEITSERFTFNANGTFTYVGLEPITAQVHYVASLDSIAFSKLAISVYQNAALVSGSKIPSTFLAAGNPVGVSTAPIVNLVTNDTVEPYVSNETSTNDVTVTDAQITVSVI